MHRWDLSCLPAFGEARIRSFYLGKNENVFTRWGPKLTQVQAQQANTTDESTFANSRCPLNFSTPSFTSVWRACKSTGLTPQNAHVMEFWACFVFWIKKKKNLHPYLHPYSNGSASSSRLASPPVPASFHFFFCKVCILRVQSTMFLSPGNVSMSLHLICIRFSTLSGSYLIPTQYAAKGNWVLRPR